MASKVQEFIAGSQHAKVAKAIRDNLPRVCIERAQAVTSSWQETEAEPQVIRRAKALGRVLRDLTKRIRDDELIVGDFINALRGSPILVEYSCEWLLEELDTLAERPGDKFDIAEEHKGKIRELISFWKGKTLRERSWYLMDEETRANYSKFFEICSNESMRGAEGFAHVVVDYEKVLTQGLERIGQDVREKLQALDCGDPAQLQKYHFYGAILITYDAVLQFAAAYAQLASEMAASEQNPQRREELREIAATCQRVPAQPARTFREALQSLWFVHIALLNESYGHAFALGRADQYLFPLYNSDIAAGRLTREDAKKFLISFYIKLNQLAILSNRHVTKYFCGHPVTQLIMLGGMGRDGRDATNSLSYLMLETDADLGLQQPESVIRVHRDTPDDFLHKACEVAKRCRGKLKFVSDNTAIKKLINQDYSEEDARDYVFVGCHEPFVPGKSSYAPGGHINLLKCFELALNNGADPASGVQVGPRSGDPLAFRSFDEVLDAYRQQVAFFIDHIIKYDSAIYEAHAQCVPTPFQSSLISGCIERGLDSTDGGALYSASWLSGAGAVNVGDSLAAVKKVVFDDKTISMGDLRLALKNDFVGYEQICRLCHEAPKFGNDDDYVDMLTRESASIFCEEFQKHRLHGYRQAIAALNANTAGIPMGAAVGATPDGRKRGMPLADGGVSPVHGKNRNGATATYRSVAKLDHGGMKCGSVLNMRFSTDALKDERKIAKFAFMLKTYCELGGYHVQFNIVDSAALKNAQQNPAEYRDLLVRVATWSAYFVDLSREVQDDIIRRTEFEEL